MKLKKYVFIVPLTMLLAALFFKTSAQSPLAKGEIYKVEIQDEGVYQITPALLSSIGFSANVNPNFIQVLGIAGGALSEDNNPTIPKLQQIAVEVIGGEDGTFDNGDQILFYAQTADAVCWNEDLQLFEYQDNPYTEKSYYYIKLGDAPSLRVPTAAQTNGTTTAIRQYTTVDYSTEYTENLIKSGRVWVGKSFKNVIAQKINFPIAGLVPNSSVKLYSQVVTQSPKPSTFVLSAYGQYLGDIAFSSGRPTYEYATLGLSKNKLLNFEESKAGLIQLGVSELKVDVRFARNQLSDNGFLNFMMLNYERQLIWENKNFILRTPAKRDTQTSRFIVRNGASNLKIWDVSTPLLPKAVSTSLSNEGLEFRKDTQGKANIFFVFDSSQLPTPSAVGKVENQDLSKVQADYLIITHSNFSSQAKRLADWRKQHDQLEPFVVNVQQIYEEFSAGRQDPMALRNFAKTVYRNSNGKFQYLLLFGDASFDYQSRQEAAFGFKNTNYVPTYQSVESLDPLKSFPSDDFFGFFDDDEDTWVENAPYDLEIGIGRLPVTTEAEAKAVVDKLIAYDNISNTLGDWKNQILFVADDGDNNLHQRQADQLAAFIDQNTKGLIANRLFMDAFPQELTSQGKRSPIMRNKLTEEVLKGNLIVNYTGHGSEMLWASEDILNVSQIKTWNNFNRLALFITATCEFGRFDNPILVSGAEYAITHPQGGALALLTTTRPVFADENFIVNKAVYNALLNKTGLRLGDVIKNSKNTIENNVNNRGFTLLGDPAAKLSFPSQRIEVTKVNQQTTNTVAVLKSLGEVEIEGQVKQGAQVLKDFQGLVYVKLFEKPSTRLTLGDEGSNTVMSYAEYTNLLFQGSASVVDGNFTFTAFIPKDINYELGTGKLTLYAVNNEKNQDASGSFSRFMIGKTKENAQTDTQPPTLEVSIGGNPVKKGQVLPSSSIWKIRVKDNSSITISGIGVGRNFEAVLDGTTQYVLNNDFQFDQNSYQAGQALLNLKNLSEGEHTMSIKVWDAFNNSTEETFTFRVVKEKAAVEKVIAFPNPFNEKVSFSVEQNQQDAVLDIVLQIFDNIGRRVYTRQKQILSEGKSVKGLEWNGTNQAGSPVNSGIYFYQILVGDSEAYSGKVLVVR